jgi:hypothetical protein
MRKVIISAAVREKLDELELYLKDSLKMSKKAALGRCDRLTIFLSSLSASVDYPPCRFRRWRELGYRCAAFEGSWVFAYEIFDEGVIVRDMSNAALLTE